MAKIYTMPEIGIIIDGIYRNYSKAKIDQKNVNKLAADCNTSANVLMKVRNILAEMQQIILKENVLSRSATGIRQNVHLTLHC